MADLAAVEVKETTRSKEAFGLYWALGPKRSLAKLADFYIEQGLGSNHSSLLRQFQQWSTTYQWQDKIRAIAAEQLESATELKTTTYVNILGEYHRRVDNEPMRRSMQLQALHGIFDRVKPEQPTASGSAGPTVIVQFAFIETTRT
jgi:hypothetical protein